MLVMRVGDGDSIRRSGSTSPSTGITLLNGRGGCRHGRSRSGMDRLMERGAAQGGGEVAAALAHDRNRARSREEKNERRRRDLGRARPHRFTLCRTLSGLVPSSAVLTSYDVRQFASLAGWLTASTGLHTRDWCHDAVTRRFGWQCFVVQVVAGSSPIGARPPRFTFVFVDSSNHRKRFQEAVTVQLRHAANPPAARAGPRPGRPAW
jgi:hypothetical protein